METSPRIGHKKIILWIRDGVQVSGFEPECLAWKAKILTARLHLRGAVIMDISYFNPFMKRKILAIEEKIKG